MYRSQSFEVAKTNKKTVSLIVTRKPELLVSFVLLMCSISCLCFSITVRPSNYSLHFPDASVSRHAQTKVEKNLRALTLSFHLRTSQRNERGTPVSYAFVNPFTGDVVDNALTISDPNKLLLYLNKESFDTGVIANDNKWHHCVVTWESNSGVWIFYWDNVEKIRGNILPGGHMFSGVLVIGQDQDELGGAFSGSEAYSGDIAEVAIYLSWCRSKCKFNPPLQTCSSICGTTPCLRRK